MFKTNELKVLRSAKLDVFPLLSLGPVDKINKSVCCGCVGGRPGLMEVTPISHHKWEV